MVKASRFSHLRSCTPNGPRFLTEKSARFGREVFFSAAEPLKNGIIFRCLRAPEFPAEGPLIHRLTA